jgi:hypothetical protein
MASAHAVSALRTIFLGWPLLFLACFAALASVVGSFRERRSHFWLRVVLLAVVPAVLPVMLAAGERSGVLSSRALESDGPILVVACAMTLIFLPLLLYRASGAAPGDSEDGNDSGPGPPPGPPPPPHGGIPLPDAEQSRARLRDHTRGERRGRKARRTSRKPERV